MERYRVKFSEIEDYSKEDWITVVDTICRYANSKLTFVGPEDILAMIGIDRVEEKEANDDEELKELFGFDKKVKPC